MNPSDLEFDLPPESEPKPVVVPDPAKPEFNAAVLKQDYNFGTPTADITYTFNIPSVPRPVLNKVMNDNNHNPNIKTDTKEFKAWKESIDDGVSAYTPNDLYLDRFHEEGSMFQQGVEKPDGSLFGISSPKFKTSEGGELKGEMAVLRFSKKLGLGDVLTVPLPHSGISVTIKPPTERDLIDFYNSIFREKVYLGRMSGGLTLTNLSVHINNRLFDFIVKHIHSVNYSDISKDQLRNYILIHDYHVLAWAFASCMYPNGFEYQRPCIADVEKCNHISKETINLLKLLWVDNTALTTAQKEILFENRPNKLGVESYKKYVFEHNRVKSRDVTLKNGIKVKLRVPTFAEHVVDGLSWTNKINTAIDLLIVTEGDEEKAKQELLQQYVSSSFLRQFGHFVEELEEDSGVVSDRETIGNVLDVMSADDGVRAELTGAILKFKSDTTIAIVGIPSYNCPVCKTNQNPDPVSDKFVSVIPLDVMMLFFTLLTLRITKILERV